MKRIIIAILSIVIFSAVASANIKFWDGDNITSKGLNGPVKDSVGYHIDEIEHHFHKCGTGGKTLSFLLGLHMYPGI